MIIMHGNRSCSVVVVVVIEGVCRVLTGMKLRLLDYVQGIHTEENFNYAVYNYRILSLPNKNNHNH